MTKHKGILAGLLAAGLAVLPAANGQVSASSGSRAALAAVPGGFLGVGIQEIDADRAKALKLKEEAGVEVTKVDEGSPAEKAGLKVGDAITEYNGQRVEGIEQFSRLVRETPAGREAVLGIVRQGAAQTVRAKLGVRSGAVIPRLQNELESLRLNIPDMPHSTMSWRSPMLGIQTERLEGQLADFFGAKEGALVRAVTKGSAAEKAGIKAGDVIIKVDDTKVAAPSDITAKLRGLSGKTVNVVVIRDHRELTLPVTLSNDDRSDRFPFGVIARA